ncbi:MAG TPA: hypothetical protein VMF10_16360 [Candidatus Aquilonibacter sp.]|nr:hypothetical protein [Candidatus Aquilonibacter sp.]
MPQLSTADALDEVKEWFAQLGLFRAACVGTNTTGMNVLEFADASIITILPSTADQENFIAAAVSATGYNDMAITDLTTTYKSFEALLDHWNPLITSIALYLWSLAVPSLQGTASADFWKAPVSTAFPSKSTDPPWKGVMDGLASVFPPECLTAGFQQKINNAFDANGTKISDIVPQIATLG